jgi:hypothetical protein
MDPPRHADTDGMIFHRKHVREQNMGSAHTRESVIATTVKGNRAKRSHMKVSLPALNFLQKEDDK